MFKNINSRWFLIVILLLFVGYRLWPSYKYYSLSNIDTEIIFQSNKELLYKFYNNKNVLLKYFELAQKLNKNEWLEFFNFFLSINDMKKEVFDIEIKNFKSTNDSDLLKLVNIIENVN